MAKIYLGSPIYSLTPAEERELNERAVQNSVLDADVQDTIDAPLGRMEIGARNSIFGGAIGRAVPYLVDVFDGGYSAPLNLTRKKSEADPIKDDFSLFNGNDPETIAEEMRNVPEDEWPWVLSSGDYNTYRRRLRYVLTAQPEAQQQGSMAGFALGLSADISAMVATGVAAEGVALAGFNTAALAGRAAASSLGIARTQRIATAVAEATNAVSRTNLAMRWTALGAGENLMWEVAHQGLDPTYDPTFGDVAESTAYSAVFSGALGGAVFGRQFVRDRVTEMVLDLRRKRVTNLPGGYTISYTDGFLFDAPAAADQMLFAPGTGSFQYEAERIAKDLWTDWQRSPKTVDLFLPGTRSVSLPVLDEAAAARLTGGFDIGDDLIPAPAAARSMPSGQPAQLFGWNAHWALAAAAKQQGIDLSTLTREQYAQFAITNGFRITDDQLRMAPSLRKATSMDEYQAIRKATRPGTPEQLAADRAFTVFADSIIQDASASKELFNGVRIRSGTANSNTWLFFKVNAGAPQAGDTHKAYAGFDNPYKALTPKKVRQFLKFLQSRGYNGDVKTIQDLDLGSSISDQIVMHGATEADAKLGQKLSREFFGDDLTFSELGIDKGGKSYSQILADKIESEINLRAAGAQVAGTPGGKAPKAAGEVRDALGRIPARPKMGQVVGLRSAIKATAFELSLAGQKLDAKVFSTIAKALVRAEKTRTRAGAFNKVFWEELSKDLDPEVVNNLRKVGERTFIPGIDRSVIDLSQRDDMVDAILEGFRAKQHLVKGEEPSLIFRVLQQIKDRNGLVTRKVVEDVVDELRKVSQNPPKTRNAKGAEILDRNARRAAIVQIINKHSKSDKAIFLPPSLLNNMNPAVAAAKGANRITRLGTADPLGTAQDASDAPRNKVRLPFGLGQMFNQSAVAHESNNGWARLVANLSFFARRDMGTAQQYTIFEEGSHKMYSLMGMFVKGYRNGFIKFALGNGTEDVTRQVGLSDALVTAFKDNKMTREYNRRVLQQLRTGAYDDALSAVNDGARGIREMFNRVHELAHAAGLPGFTKAAVNNYFPRMWRWDKVRRLATTKEGRAALESLIRQSIDQNGRRVIIDGVETAFEGDIDDAAKAFSERLIAIAEGTENAPLVQQEQELFDAITRLEGPLKAKAGSKTPYGRSRMLLNESSEVTSGDLLGAGKNTLSIADLTNDDLPFVVRKYITSVMGAVNEKRLLDAFNAEMKARGILKPTTVKKGEEVSEDLTVDSVDKMLAMVKKLGGTLEAKHESALREIIAAMRYEPIHHGRTATTDRIMSILMPYGYLTTGGQFGLAQIGEIARIVGTLGVSNTVKQMPILMEMISNWKNLDQDTKGMSVFLNQWFSPSTDRLRRTMVQGLSDMQPDDYGSLVARGTTATARYLDKAANLMSDVSLLAPFQSFTQQLTAAATLQHMMEAARGATKWLDDSTVRTLGLEPEQYRALAKWVSDNAEEANGRIVGISKPDAVEMDKLVKLVDRMVRTRIQDIPTRGDFAKGMFSALGRMMLQFRTFNLKGVDNFLLQNSSRVVSGAPGAKAKVASEIGATLVIAGSIQWLRNAADWSSYKASGDTEKADEIEERMTWDGFARGAMTGPSEFFVPIMLTDAFTQTFVSKDPIFSPYRYSGLSLYSFPSFALAKRAAGLGTDIYGSTVGQALGLDLEREVTQSTIHKARLLMPFQNLIGLKQYFNILEQDIVDYYNLPEIQPRNRE